jgi:hypothetical protein
MEYRTDNLYINTDVIYYQEYYKDLFDKKEIPPEIQICAKLFFVI